MPTTMRRSVADATVRVGPYILGVQRGGRGYEVRLKAVVLGTVLPRSEANGRPGWQIGEDQQPKPHVYRSLAAAAREVGTLFEWTVEAQRCGKTGQLGAFFLKLRRPWWRGVQETD